MDAAPLFDLELLDQAWQHVRSGGDAAGIDGVTLPAFEADLHNALSVLAADVAHGRYCPQAYRTVDLPKLSGGYRRIVIPTIRDRVLQTALAMQLEPILEPLLLPCCFAYRKGRGVQDALLEVAKQRDRGARYVLHADICSFFDTVPHRTLLAFLLELGVPTALQQLVAQALAAPILAPVPIEDRTRGLPQGLPICPLLANVYLIPFDRTMLDAGWALVRYADDLVVCCAERHQADQAREHADAALAPLGLSLSDTKTSVYSFEDGFVFLGARFAGNTLIPAMPHPYEAQFKVLRAVRPARPPAQILPRTLQRTLYIQEQGSQLACRKGHFVVQRGKDLIIRLPVHHVDQIFILGSVQITSSTMAYCLLRNVPIHLFSGKGRYYGVLHSVFDRSHRLRRAQFARVEDPKERLAFAKAVVRAKIANCRTLLAHHQRNHPSDALADIVHQLATSTTGVEAAHSVPQLRGVEGHAAAVYYQGFGLCCRGDLRFTQRSRRPPTDPINSMLSFAYTLVFYNIYSYLCARGLDPCVGFLHEGAVEHPALASDLLEELRAPVVDSMVLALVNRGEFTEADFYRAEGNPQPCLFRDESRVRFLHAFEAKMASLLHHPDVSFEVDWRRVIDLQVQRCRRYIEGSSVRYEPFIHR